MKSSYQTEEYYEEKFKEQKGCCAICHKSVEDVKRKVLCADHNHETKKPRGLLCPVCNLLLGYAYDDIKTLKSAIKYLEKYKG